MSKKYRPYNSSNTKNRGFQKLLVFIFLLFLFRVGSEYIYTPFRINNSSMEPILTEKARIISINSALHKNHDRGDLVLVDRGLSEIPLPIKILDPVVRFFTLENFSALEYYGKSWEQNPQVKRIIALPGDTIKIEKSVAYVRPAGEEFFLTEFELTSHEYDILVEKLPEGWLPTHPLSGFMEEVTIPEDTVFVIGDNRQQYNDSRFWGTIPESAVKGVVIFQYWPLSSLGSL